MESQDGIYKRLPPGPHQVDRGALMQPQPIREKRQEAKLPAAFAIDGKPSVYFVPKMRSPASPKPGTM